MKFSLKSLKKAFSQKLYPAFPIIWEFLSFLKINFQNPSKFPKKYCEFLKIRKFPKKATFRAVFSKAKSQKFLFPKRASSPQQPRFLKNSRKHDFQDFCVPGFPSSKTPIIRPLTTFFSQNPKKHCFFDIFQIMIYVLR